MKTIFLFLAFFVSVPFIAAQEPLRVIVFGAHPDDCDQSSGGVAALYSQMGHKVKFVAITNGNKGHQSMTSADLATRRQGELQAAGKILGVEYVTLNQDDGELQPSLENRFAVIKLICDWKADLVIAPRPNDYHPDHRYTSILVQDAAYMITVPKMVPDGTALRKSPVFMYCSDRFMKPQPFTPDVVVDITSVAEKKADAICAHESQMYEWLPWNQGWEKDLPATAAARRKFVGDRYLSRYTVEDRFREAALKWYTPEQMQKIKYVEAFEICEYGTIPNTEMLKKLFPMLP